MVTHDTKDYGLLNTIYSVVVLEAQVENQLLNLSKCRHLCALAFGMNFSPM